MTKSILEEDIVQALKDIGCSQSQTECFIKYMNQNEMEKGLALLREHRSCLLDQVHIRERQISCLDYLVYNFEKMEG